MVDGKIDELAHAVAGSAGGLLSMTLTYPLVTLSTNAQVKKKSKDALSQVETIPEEDESKNDDSEQSEEEKKKKSFIKITVNHTIQKLRNYYSQSDFNSLIKAKGIKGIYDGLESALLGIAVTNFVYYYFYELVGSRLSKGASGRLGLTAKQSILAGAVAGTISRLVTNPIWVANTRMQVLASQSKSGKKSLNTLTAIYQIFKNEGVSKLFSGVVPALFLVLNPIIQYTIFEQLKTLLVKSRNRKFTPLDALLLGSLGKLIATIATYPYITLRSRMHLQKMNTPSSTSLSAEDGSSDDGNMNASIQSLPETPMTDSTQLPPLPKPIFDNELVTMFKMAKDIIQKEGILAMYNGLSVKLLQSILSAGFLFYFKEELVVGSDRLIKFIRMFNYVGQLQKLRLKDVQIVPAPVAIDTEVSEV